MYILTYIYIILLVRKYYTEYQFKRFIECSKLFRTSKIFCVFLNESAEKCVLLNKLYPEVSSFTKLPYKKHRIYKLKK